MFAARDGGAAFPHDRIESSPFGGGVHHPGDPGMSLRDWFAGRGLHRHEHDGWPRRRGAILQWTWDSRAVDQGGQVRAELDSTVVPSVRGQPGASVSVRPGVQPWELPSPAVSAQGGQALVAAERAGQADQGGRPSGAALPVVDLSVVRGVGSSTVVPGSAGSYRPVIAGAKLREVTTTILPRGGERSRSRFVFNAVSPHWQGTRGR